MANVIPFVYPPQRGDVGDVLKRVGASQYADWGKPDVRVNPATGAIERWVARSSGGGSWVELEIDGGTY